MGFVIVLIVLATSLWVLIDATSIGVKKGQIEGLGNMGPWGWFFACLGLWIIAFPMYLAKRGELKKLNQTSSKPEDKMASPEEEATTTAQSPPDSDFCPSCGGVVNSDQQFCQKCGEPLSDKSQEVVTSNEKSDDGIGCIGFFVVLNGLLALAGYGLYQYLSQKGELALTQGDINYVVFVLVGINLYMIPSYVAYSRGHKNKEGVFAVNLIFGGTMIGWGIALVWSLSSTD